MSSSETFFIFGKRKGNKTSKNVIYIGEKGDYKTLESYLRLEKDEYIYDFTKNHLSKTYFKDEDFFISYENDNPLELRLREPLIPRRSIVIIPEDDEEIDFEDISLNRFEFEDYDIFSGEEIEKESHNNYKEEIYDSIKDLSKVLYQMLDAGYLDLENLDKIDDWIITFQDPILDIFIRYHRLETSAEDISTCDEYLINPEFRKTICVMMMKIISNFIVNNNLIDTEDLSRFKSWNNKEIWYFLRDETDFLRD